MGRLKCAALGLFTLLLLLVGCGPAPGTGAPDILPGATVVPVTIAPLPPNTRVYRGMPTGTPPTEAPEDIDLLGPWASDRTPLEHCSGKEANIPSCVQATIEANPGVVFTVKITEITPPDGGQRLWQHTLTGTTPISGITIQPYNCTVQWLDFPPGWKASQGKFLHVLQDPTSTGTTDKLSFNVGCDETPRIVFEVSGNDGRAVFAHMP